jgi:dihydrofolate synthase/folylpolyglutamate synthase
LGGRLDATNVLKPLVSVITSIDLEHTSILGTSLRAIAREKAGIIKPGVPCVTGVHQPKARDVVQNTCRKRHAPLRSNDSVRHTTQAWGWNGTTADFWVGRTRYKGLTVSFPGEHQLANASTALLTLEELRKRYRLRIPRSAVKYGLANIALLTGLRGRLTVVKKRPLVVVDVAHNPAAMGILSGALDDLRAGPVVFVLGVMRDKDLAAIARQLAPNAAQVIAVAARTERSLPASSVARVVERSGIPVAAAPSVAAGVRRALKLANRRPVVITGSHFVVGEALAMLEGRNYLTINQ